MFRSGAEATRIFGTGIILSSVSEPGLDKTAEASRTVNTDSYSLRERDIAKRHQRRRARVADARIFQAQFNWRDVERIKKGFHIPLILKRIATVEDARIAVEHGVDCVYVSNHGGRQLDQGVGSIDVLPEVVEAVGGRAHIIVDGGISRGTDVVKALILGADAVACGRLYVYGLAAAGAEGMMRLFEILEGRDPHLPVAARRDLLPRARQILHPPGAPSRAAARPQRLPPPQPGARDVLAAAEAQSRREFTPGGGGTPAAPRRPSPRRSCRGG